MKKYRELFERIISDLEGYSEISIKEAEIGYPSPIDEFKQIESDFQIQLSEDIKAFYPEIGFVNISWSFKHELEIKGKRYQVNGKIYILTLHDSFYGFDNLGWQDVLWFKDLEDQEKMKNLRPFDFYDMEENGCVCFNIDDNKVEKDLIIYSTSEGYHPIKLNIEEYCDLLTQTKGLDQSQYLLVKVPINENEIFQARMADFLPLLIKDKKEFERFRKNGKL